MAGYRPTANRAVPARAVDVRREEQTQAVVKAQRLGQPRAASERADRQELGLALGVRGPPPRALARSCAGQGGRYALTVDLKVGDVVAYPPHGVGRVSARQKRMVLGTKQEVVVLELDGELSVTLTLERARELVRPLLDEAGIQQVRDTLRADGTFSEEAWAQRLKDAQAKLRSGDPLDLAEIVRDGAQRERALTGPKSSKPSVSERAVWTKARDLLSGEIGLVRGLDRAEASAWIDEQLAPLGR